MSVDRLTDKQRRFVGCYLRYLNGAKAARMAGYSVKNSDVAANKLMKKPWVKAAIEKGLREQREMRAAEIQLEQDRHMLAARGRGAPGFP